MAGARRLLAVTAVTAVMVVAARGTSGHRDQLGGPADYLDETTGILVDPEDREQFIAGLTAALVRMAGSPELRRSMGAAGRARVEEVYDWQRKIVRMIEIYREVQPAGLSGRAVGGVPRASGDPPALRGLWPSACRRRADLAERFGGDGSRVWAAGDARGPSREARRVAAGDRRHEGAQHRRHADQAVRRPAGRLGERASRTPDAWRRDNARGARRVPGRQARRQQKVRAEKARKELA